MCHYLSSGISFALILSLLIFNRINRHNNSPNTSRIKNSVPITTPATPHPVNDERSSAVGIGLLLLDGTTPLIDSLDLFEGVNTKVGSMATVETDPENSIHKKYNYEKKFTQKKCTMTASIQS